LNYNICHEHKNNLVYMIFKTKTKTHVGLIPNPDMKQGKQEQEHDMCKTRIQKKFITITKQKQNKLS
jgi:hypothetical protein